MEASQWNGQKMKDRCHDAVAVQVKFPLAPTIARRSQKLLHAQQHAVAVLFWGQH